MLLYFTLYQPLSNKAIFSNLDPFVKTPILFPFVEGRVLILTLTKAVTVFTEVTLRSSTASNFE